MNSCGEKVFVVAVCWILHPSSCEFLFGTFPPDFKFGISGAAYQIEGGWNEDGKGMNIWDKFVHQSPSPIVDGSTGDVACDSYHKYGEDVSNLKKLGVQIYRMSISWSRILPTGRTNHVNAAGVNYYNQLIGLLLDNNLTPFVTILHFDLPQPIEDIGGWLSEKTAYLFREYAILCFRLFGDRVKYWTTINEANIYSLFGYGEGMLAPGYNRSGILDYKAGHEMIKAHALAYRAYDKMFRKTQKGLVSIVLNVWWFEPKTSAPEDKAAAERAMQFMVGWFTHPIYIGGYPPVMRSVIDARSKREGLKESRLPAFTARWRRFIKGTADYFGVNHYDTRLAQPDSNNPTVSYYNDVAVKLSSEPSWPATKIPGRKMTPFGMRKILNWIKENYGDYPVYITENGIPDNGTLDDMQRVRFYQGYMNEVLKAITIDKCPVKAYMPWAFIDNFEWNEGYTQKYGLIQVNFTDPERTRTWKTSAKYYQQMVKQRGFFQNTTWPTTNLGPMT